MIIHLKSCPYPRDCLHIFFSPCSRVNQPLVYKPMKLSRITKVFVRTLTKIHNAVEAQLTTGFKEHLLRPCDDGNCVGHPQVYAKLPLGLGVSLTLVLAGILHTDFADAKLPDPGHRIEMNLQAKICLSFG